MCVFSRELVMWRQGDAMNVDHLDGYKLTIMVISMRGEVGTVC